MTGNLLSEAADWFKARQTGIQSWYSDDRGRYAFRVTVDDQDFVVTAKKYLKAGDASFMASKVVQRAIDRDALLVLFVKDGGYQYVFDPAAVKEYGEAPDPDESKRARDGEDWLDVTARFGVAFDDWYEGRSPPRHPNWQTTKKADGGQTGLGDFDA